jgi:hypothetical protein
MKSTLALLTAGLLCAATAQAAGVKVEAVMATGPQEEPTTTFAADTPKIYALFKTEGAKSGDKLRSVWTAVDVGEAAPKGTKIDEKTITADGDTDDGIFSLSKPTKGWPAGKYKVEIYVNDELATMAKFTIKSAKSKKDGEDGEGPDHSSDE